MAEYYWDASPYLFYLRKRDEEISKAHPWLPQPLIELLWYIVNQEAQELGLMLPILIDADGI